jgi:RNase P/RNase MRP subunit POP5
VVHECFHVRLVFLWQRRANSRCRRMEKGNLTEAFFKNALHHALEQRFGLLYAHPHLDLLQYNQDTMQGIVRCERWMKEKVNAAFTLMTLLPDDKTPCRCDVTAASPFLFSIT